MPGETHVHLTGPIALIPICIVTGLVLFWIFRERSGLKSVIKKFMEAGAARNVEAAYAYCSLQSAAKEEIAGLIESNYDVFAGYKRLTIDSSVGESSVSITGVRSASSRVRGAIIYADGKRMPFKASLVKENGVWKIINMQIGSTEKVDIVKRLSIRLGGPPGPGR